MQPQSSIVRDRSPYQHQTARRLLLQQAPPVQHIEQVGGFRVVETHRTKPFFGVCHTIDYTPNSSKTDLVEFLNEIQPKLQQRLGRLLGEHSGLKAGVSVTLTYAKTGAHGDENDVPATLRTKLVKFLNIDQIVSRLANFSTQILNANANYIRGKSGLAIKHIDTPRYVLANTRHSLAVIGSTFHTFWS